MTRSGGGRLGEETAVLNRRNISLHISAGVAIAGASLIAVPAIPRPPEVQVPAVQLTGGDTADSPLGDGVALIMGTSGNPAPNPDTYLPAVDQIYLQPLGFGGTTQLLPTPEALSPFTGATSLPFDVSEAQDLQVLDAAILSQIAGGQVDATHPVVVWGWSQSSDIAGMTMAQLTSQGVPSDDVHFVLTGDANNPNGGVLERFDMPAGVNPQDSYPEGSFPSLSALGVPFNGATPADLYPTDVFTNEYDGAADFPQYPMNFLADVNALAGIVFDHIMYPVLTPEQIASAIELPTSATDTLTNYYMIPEDLPLLDILRFIPVIGNPLADLLQPDLSVLVNLGYGSITDGWSQAPADVPTPFGLFPTDLNWSEVLTALANGVPQGITAAINDLQDPADYQIIPSILDNPLTTQLIGVAHALGFTDATNLTQMLDYPSLQDAIPNLLGVAQNALGTFANFPISDATLLSPPTDIINDLSNTLSYDYSSLLPLADAANALLTNIPAYDASIFVDQLQAGNLLDAVGDPIAADLVLVPLTIGFGAANAIEAVAGSLINLVDLIPGI
jgi:hypothetical protein